MREREEKLGYFLYFTANFTDWCTDSTTATAIVKK